MDRQLNKEPQTTPIKQTPSNPAINSRIQALFKTPLKPETFDFFQALAFKRMDVFIELYETLARYCHDDELFLNASHIDAVVNTLQKQVQLPDNIEPLLHDYVRHTDPDGTKIRAMIETLRVEKLPWLITQAKQNHYGHHTLYHASEIKVRTTRAAKQLGLFVEDDPLNPHFLRNQFLRPIIRFAIECHDYIQGKSGTAALGGYATAELATAEAVKSWLFSSMDFPDEIKQWLELQIDHAIVLATTLIFSKKKPLHLAHIFSLFEEKAEQAGMPVASPSNRSLINETQAMNIVIGACDILAASMRVVAQGQYAQELTNSLHNLKIYFSNERLVLDDFFARDEFKPYFSTGLIEESYETFLMTNPPHVLMCAELKVIPTSDEVIPYALFETSEQARLMINFIQNCQKIHRENNSEFSAYFERGFNNNQLSDAMIHLFFSRLDAEIEFIKSLVPLIALGEKKLKDLGYVNEQGEAIYALNGVDVAPTHRFLDPSIAQTDAENLLALRLFFADPSTDKQRLIKEFLLNTVFQAGTTYIEHPKLGATNTEPSTPIDCQTPTERMSLTKAPSMVVNFAGTTHSFYRSNSIRTSLQSDKHTSNSAEPNASLESNPWNDIPHMNDDYDSDSDKPTTYVSSV